MLSICQINQFYNPWKKGFILTCSFNKIDHDIGPLNKILSISEDNKELSPTYIDNASRKAPSILTKSKRTELIDDIGVIYRIRNLRGLF